MEMAFPLEMTPGSYHHNHIHCTNSLHVTFTVVTSVSRLLTLQEQNGDTCAKRVLISIVSTGNYNQILP